jgi:hypothetical protein
MQHASWSRLGKSPVISLGKLRLPHARARTIGQGIHGASSLKKPVTRDYRDGLAEQGLQFRRGGREVNGVAGGLHHGASFGLRGWRATVMVRLACSQVAQVMIPASRSPS